MKYPEIRFSALLYTEENTTMHFWLHISSVILLPCIKLLCGASDNTFLGMASDCRTNVNLWDFFIVFSQTLGLPVF